MIPRAKERLGGAVLLALGVALTRYGWHVVATQGWFNVAGTWMGPACAAMGAALLAFPGYRSERAARGEDVDALQGLALLTPRWRVVLAVALALGALNHVLALTGHTPVL